MEVRADGDAEEVEDQVTYLYKLVLLMQLPVKLLTLCSFRLGRSRDSFGTKYAFFALLMFHRTAVLIQCRCAAMNGIDLKIIERADQLVLMSARGEDLVAACAVMKDSEARDYEDAVSDGTVGISDMALIRVGTDGSSQKISRMGLQGRRLKRPHDGSARCGIESGIFNVGIHKCVLGPLIAKAG